MALDAIGLIGGKDRLQEISMRLAESHLTYLQLDDSPQKLQARHKLEGFIKEYLRHVPNERKYVFQETADILHRSAATVKDFSGYRACTAWSAISLYAANLLAQPWRKEYRTLRTYSGYYKHEIEANLIGAELMFELMGYKHTSLGVLTLEGPIDPDKVSSVSRDAIVAFVECQILKEIWEGVSKFFTISWLEVLEFRWNSVGSSEQAIRALKFRFLERIRQIQEKTNAATYREYRYEQPMGIDGALTALSPSTIPYHAIAPASYKTAMIPSVCKPDSVYPSEGGFYFAPVEAASLGNRFATPYACAALMPRYHPASQSGLGNSAILSSTPGHATRVPTARLIELDTPVPVAHYERNLASFNELPSKSSKSRNHEIDSDDVDFHRSQSSENERPYYARVDKKSASKLPPRNNDETRHNNWEFVYRSLESLGYSKDLGERDDVLRKKELLQEARNSSRTLQKSAKSLANFDNDDKYEKYGKRRSGAASGLRETNFNDGINTSSINGQENRVREILGVRKKGNSLELQDSTLGFIEAASEKNLAGFERPSKKCSNTLPSSRAASRSGHETSGKNAEACRDGDRQNDAKFPESSRWNCAFCTFLNPPGQFICEICGKSKRKGNEDKPLASGGKECPKCTLVNEKNAGECEACGTSLKDSPTYI